MAAVGVAAPSLEALGHEAEALADQLHLPLILLPVNTVLDEISREVITFVVSFRDDVERKATEISQQLLQLSAQGAGMQGVCQHLANSRNKWVIVQDADQRIRFQASPALSDALLLPLPVTDELLRLQGLNRAVEPILIRHEIVGYLSVLGSENDFDYLERIILGQVTPILALEFARERERSEVESRYQVEALTDVLQGHYQQPEEMLGRARILGYDLTTPQVVVIFEMSPSEPDFSNGSLIAQWSKRVREELLRIWPTCWLLSESRRVIGLLPLSELECNLDDERECEAAIFSRMERLQTRMQQSRANGPRVPLYTCGVGRLCRNLKGIPLSNREAQQALEVGRRLFGEGKIHSFARLGIYRLLFYLDGQNELNDFYQETLGPLLAHDARNNDSTLIETLEGFFRCNGNLSETARTMHLHRNSLLYRLDRIQEILGHSLEDSELRLSLQIALKIHHLHKR